jgi:hypothetical protein
MLLLSPSWLAVCVSAHIGAAATRRIFVKFDISELLCKSVEKIQISLKWGEKISGAMLSIFINLCQRHVYVNNRKEGIVGFQW